MRPLHELGLVEAAAGLRAGRFGSLDYTRACLARIAAREPDLRAWAWLDAEAALARAAACDAAPATGPLHGIPLGIKDILHSRGIPTEMGSPAYAGFVPDASAEAVARLEAAGAFVLGKTVTAELAFLSPGPTRNPWNPAHTPGGSSSGSAAAVAVGMVPGALGTQTNGSVIRPAAYCGVVGFKPSSGLIPRDGILTFSASLDQVGVFARDVADAGLLAAALISERNGGTVGASSRSRWPDRGREAAPERWRGDETMVECNGGSVGESSRSRWPPRLLAVRSPVWEQAEAAQRDRFADCLAALRRAGATLEETALPAAFAAAQTAHRCIMAYEGARALADLQDRRRADLSPLLNAFLDEGRAVGDAAHAEALARRAELAAALDAFLAGADAVLSPPATGEAPASLESTGSPVFCTIWSLTGVPALTLPAGRGPRGLPLGLQLAGRHGDDAGLLAAAAWCEAALARAGLGP
jgi:Asp-tRNA(Asn)/Glu-tRNA(Gln) amidotransferase A subunit family amidase